MNRKDLERKMSQLGFPLLEVEETLGVNKTLAEVVRSDDLRYWEGFPVLLANANRAGAFDAKEVEASLASESDLKKWRELVVMSLVLYRTTKRRFEWANRMKKNFSEEEEKLFWRLRDHMGHSERFRLGDKEFSVARLKTLFDNYMQNQALKVQETQAKYDELSLEFALSQVFSPKQKELFKKKMNGEPMTKTEREYFSRTVRKKLRALANADLHRLAQRSLE
jgi:hypothetical protein